MSEVRIMYKVYCKTAGCYCIDKIIFRIVFLNERKTMTAWETSKGLLYPCPDAKSLK